jgi:endo-1,4-beta-xylanase
MWFPASLRASFLLIFVCLAAPCLSQSLRQEADRIGVMIGAAANPAYFAEPAYASTLAREFNMLQPEDAMKWFMLRPNEKTFNFGPADNVVGFARTHGMKVRGHTLVWGGHNPGWLASGHYNPQRLLALLQEHIRRVVERYRSAVFAWDVVNEAFDENGKLRDSLWYNQPGIGLSGQGTAYIEQAFRWAHAADPQALLFYNDAGGEPLNRKSDAIYAMAKDFRRRGVPIDGIGLQMHIYDLNPDVASIAANIERFTGLGLQVHITEMDVALPVDERGKPRSPADLNRQAEIYREIAGVCLAHPGCTAFQTWGFTDKYSWLGWFSRGTKAAGLLFDKEYRPKPAYDAVKQAFLAHGSRARPAVLGSVR